MTHPERSNPVQSSRVANWLAAAWIVMLTTAWVLPVALFVTALVFDRASHPMTGPGAAGVLVAVAICGWIGWQPPNWYWRLHEWERRGRMYRLLGVPVFGRFVIRGRHLQRVVRRVDPTTRRVLRRDELPIRMTYAVIGERIHLTQLLGSLPLLAVAIAERKSTWIAFFAFGNLILNIYPVMLQRMMRARLTELAADRPATRS